VGPAGGLCSTERRGRGGRDQEIVGREKDNGDAAVGYCKAKYRQASDGWREAGGESEEICANAKGGESKDTAFSVCKKEGRRRNRDGHQRSEGSFCGRRFFFGRFSSSCVGLAGGGGSFEWADVLLRESSSSS
jgi:hypothetical protein